MISIPSRNQPYIVTDTVAVSIEKCAENNAVIAAMTQTTDVCLNVLESRYQVPKTGMFSSTSITSIKSYRRKESDTFVVCFEPGTVLSVNKITVNQSKDLVEFKIRAAGESNVMLHGATFVVSTAASASIDKVQLIDEKTAKKAVAESLKRFKHQAGSKNKSQLAKVLSEHVKGLSIEEFEKSFGHARLNSDYKKEVRPMMVVIKSLIEEKLVDAQTFNTAGGPERGTYNIDIGDSLSVDQMERVIACLNQQTNNIAKTCKNKKPVIIVTIRGDKYNTKIKFSYVKLGVLADNVYSYQKSSFPCFIASTTGYLTNP